MGLLDFLRPKDPLEERLVRVYGTPLACELGSKHEAQATIRKLIRKIKDSYGGMSPPRGLFGEEILNVESADPQRREYFQWVRSEGVTDEDIRAWWNLHQLERDLLVELDDLHRTCTFLRKKSLGLDDEDAAEETRKLSPDTAVTTTRPGATAPTGCCPSSCASGWSVTFTRGRPIASSSSSTSTAPGASTR